MFSLIADNENGKADARLAARQQLAINLYRDDTESAGKLAVRIGDDLPQSIVDVRHTRARETQHLGQNVRKRIDEA